VTGEVHASADEGHALGAETPLLDLGPEAGAEGDATTVADDSMPGHVGLDRAGERAQRPAHCAGAVGDTE